MPAHRSREWQRGRQCRRCVTGGGLQGGRLEPCRCTAALAWAAGCRPRQVLALSGSAPQPDRRADRPSAEPAQHQSLRGPTHAGAGRLAPRHGRRACPFLRRRSRLHATATRRALRPGEHPSRDASTDHGCPRGAAPAVGAGRGGTLSNYQDWTTEQLAQRRANLQGREAELRSLMARQSRGTSE